MNKAAEIVSAGGIGVIATDTIYGIVGQALRRDTVERIYKVKKRTPTKPFIILISDAKDLKLFSITIDQAIQTSLETYWPGPVSIILECHTSELEYLHRGTNSLAFRMPAKPELVELLQLTGPLVAPSANPEGLTPAKDIAEARIYFGEEVDFYQEGSINLKPSKIIKITKDGIEVIRA
jgi:L-threonylcarbamoyladenylate synthase